MGNIIWESSITLTCRKKAQKFLSGKKKVDNLIERGMKKALKSKVVTYNYARKMKGATEIKTSRLLQKLIIVCNKGDFSRLEVKAVSIR
jgi:isocitrate dehydrogenase